MRSLVFSVFLLLLFIAQPVRAEPFDDKPYIALSETLFPETKDWQSLSSFPPVGAERLKQLREALVSSYKAAKISAPFDASFIGAEDCSPIAQAINVPGAAPLRALDANGDGAEDIIYSGGNACVDTDMTILWLGGKEGYTVSQGVLWSDLVLKIRPSADVDVSSVEAGCCADFTDTYKLGSLLRGTRARGAAEIYKFAEVPPVPLATPYHFTAKGELALRSAPVRKDGYNEDESIFVQHAVFGNILRSYMKGASGRVLAEKTDDAGKSWLYVLMDGDEEGNKFILSDPYKVDTGWIEPDLVQKTGNP